MNNIFEQVYLYIIEMINENKNILKSGRIQSEKARGRITFLALPAIFVYSVSKEMPPFYAT